MLNRKFAIAMAAAMVLAVLYGCSSDSGIKRDRDEAIDRADTAEMTLAAVRTALGVAADADQAAILAAINEATADKLVMIRSALGLASDADEAAILTAIGGLQTDEGTVAAVRTALGIAADADRAAILAAINSATTDDLVTIRSALGLASDAGPAAIVAAIGGLDLGPADLKTEYLHEQAVVAGINAADAARPMVGDVAVAFDLTASAGDLEAADTGAPDAGMSVQAMLSKMDEDEDAGTTTTTKAFVYSNRSAPGDLEWNKYYDQADRTVDGTDNAPGMAAVASVQGVDDEGADATTDDIVAYRLTFAANVSADSDKFMADAFPSNDLQTYSYSENPDGDADTMDDNRKFMGSYHGVMGEYECTDSCMATTNAKGELITLTGTWQFTPADGASMVTGVDADTTYTYFGYWLQAVEDEDGKETIGVNTFSGGSNALGVSDMGAFDCEGLASGACSATYSGKAGGKYAVKTITSRGAVATLHTGQFVADVELTANFGGDTIAAADADEISGTITNFNDAADSMNRIAHWSVMLGTAETDSDTGDANVGATTGMHGDVASGEMKGMWTHTFYNRPAADADTTDISEENMPPGDVAGMFDAHWTDGHAIGAYGASRD